MNILQELKRTYGITVGTPEAIKHSTVVATVLLSHQHAFTHFITIQPRRFTILDHVSTVIRDEFAACLPGMSPGRNARFFISVSIASRWFYRTLTEARDVHVNSMDHFQQSRTWHQPADAFPLIAPWHLHALVGSLPESVSVSQLGDIISKGTTFSDVNVQRIHGGSALSSYITDSRRGNHLMGLQFTNDTYLFNQCLYQGVHLNWCPPRRQSSQ